MYSKIKQHNVGVLLGIIDLHAVLHIAKYGASAQGIAKKDESTFLIHNFLYKLRHICTKLPDAHIVFACDSMHSKRKEIFETYKFRRGTKTDEQIYLDSIAFPQFAEIKEYVLPAIGYRNVIEEEGYEADDVIASICKNYPVNNKIIVTEDKDLYQLLTTNTAVLTPKTCKYYTIDDFKEEYGIRPSKWAEVKTLGGCASDSIPGIHNITASGAVSQRCFGEKTALKYIRGEMSKNSTLYKSVSDPRNTSVIERNRKLVTLPYEGMPDVKIRANKLSVTGFLDMTEKYGFKVMQEDTDIFKRVLRLK